VAALLSKTVISRANLLPCSISGQASPSVVGRDRARDVINSWVLFHASCPSPFARAPARKKEREKKGMHTKLNASGYAMREIFTHDQALKLGAFPDVEVAVASVIK
jgi:hypothetical protein